MPVQSVIATPAVAKTIVYPCLREYQGGVYYFIDEERSIIVGWLNGYSSVSKAEADIEDINIKDTKDFVGTVTLSNT